MGCIFCKIAGGEIPCRKVYEDAHALVFMDIAEDVDGHMVAIPKKHVENVFDCDGETLCNLMSAVKKVTDHCVGLCNYDGINLLHASGKSAGQSVPHLHIHIIPRKTGDGIEAWPPFKGAKMPIDEVWKTIKL